VLARAVRGNHLQPTIDSADLATRHLHTRADLRVLSHLAGDVEQNARLLAGRGADNYLLSAAT
jgi:hypothetical protein